MSRLKKSKIFFSKNEVEKPRWPAKFSWKHNNIDHGNVYLAEDGRMCMELVHPSKAVPSPTIHLLKPILNELGFRILIIFTFTAFSFLQFLVSSSNFSSHFPPILELYARYFFLAVSVRTSPRRGLGCLTGFPAAGRDGPSPPPGEGTNHRQRASGPGSCSCSTAPAGRPRRGPGPSAGQRHGTAGVEGGGTATDISCSPTNQ